MLQGQLYQRWYGRLRVQVGEARVTQVRNVAWLIVGMFLSRSVHLEHIARKLPIRAKKLSVSRRLRRLLDNAAIRVRPWYEPTARWLLHNAGVNGEIRLVIDSTKVSANHRLLMVAVAYRRRALPLAWTWSRSQFAHSTARKQAALLGYVQSLLPPNKGVVLVGDGEFGTSRLLRQLQQWGWQYVLRQAGHTSFQVQARRWQRFQHVPLQPGLSLWLPQVCLNQGDPVRTNLLLHWQPGERQPWYLATSFASGFSTLLAYRKRMWIEELFGDLKRHGFDLEASRLRHVLRLSRLTLMVCWLYLWLVALGEHIWRYGLRDEVDRTDRRDLSIFRLGWDWLERRLALDDPLPPVRWPLFLKLSGR